MNEYCTICLKDRKHNEKTTEPFQLSTSIDVNTFTTYLNKVYNCDSKYMFYYQNKVIDRMMILELIEKYNLDYEKTITIEYVDLDEDHPELVLECKEPIVKMVSFNEKLYLLHYNGKISILDINLINNVHDNKDGIRFLDIAASNKIYGISKNAIYDIEECSEVRAFSEELCKITANDNGYSVLAADNSVYVVNNDEEEKIMFQSKCRSVKMNEKCAYWIESLNVIEVCKLRNKKRKHYVSKETLTDVVAGADAFYCSTSTGKMVEIKNENLKIYDVNIWYQEQLIFYKGLLFLRSQNGIYSVDSADFSIKNEIHFRKILNYMEIHGDYLFVSAECAIYRVLLSNLTG